MSEFPQYDLPSHLQPLTCVELDSLNHQLCDLCEICLEELNHYLETSSLILIMYLKSHRIMYFSFKSKEQLEELIQLTKAGNLTAFTPKLFQIVNSPEEN